MAQNTSFHSPQGPDEDIPPGAFYVESHIADAMPLAHWHDHVELNYLPAGSMEYLLNGQRVRLRRRRLGVFWAAVHHQVVSVDPAQRLFCAYVPVGLFLSLPLAADFRAAVLRGDLVQAAAPSPTDALRFGEMVSAWAEAGEALRQIWLEEVLLRLRRMAQEPLGAAVSSAPPGHGAGSRAARHVERMTAFINRTLGPGRHLGVNEVAAAAGLHPTTARAAFARVLGIGVGSYIRRQRLSLAMRLLAETDLGIAEVAHEAGYSSVPRLYEAFRAQTGKTPRAYRADIRARIEGRNEGRAQARRR